MKRILLGGAVFTVAAAAYSLWSTVNHKDDLLAILVAAHPNLTEENVTLEGCTFRVDATEQAGKGAARSIVQAHLAHYILDRANVQEKSGKIIVTYARQDVGPDMVAQVSNFVAQFPSERLGQGNTLTLFPAGGGATVQRADLPKLETQSELDKFVTDALKQPGGQITSQIMAPLIDSDDGTLVLGQAHPDAPKFHDMAERIIALQSPTSFRIVLYYSEIAAT